MRRLEALRKNYAANKMLYWLSLPIVLYVFVFQYIPMGGLLMAFQDYSLTKGIFGSKWVGLKNFETFFNGLYFGRTMRNTLMLSFLDLAFAFPAPILFALMLNEVKHARFKKTIQTVSYMPHFISMIVVVGIINDFTNSSGLIAGVVTALGGTAKSYIAMPQYFRTIYTVSSVWQSIGFNSIIYLSALSGIDAQLYEAAEIDGAGRIRQLIHVTFAGLSSTIIIMLIMRCGAILSVNFEKVLLMYSPATYETADVISTYVYRMGVEGQKFGYSTAVGLFNSIVGFVLIVGANKLSKTFTEVSMF